ncbi:MAG TPA: N-acetylmuramic acid 6-phosphate etherase [Nocardioides sp.]|jgi:N-acetylmuramic acid 6-phosphate etherase|nr:N-acetylmuramic acid 6-phosphate etherase [Nocardioides sp.]
MTQAHDSARLAQLGTEAVRPDLRDLDERSTADLVRLVLDEHHAVDAALEHGAPAIVEAVDAVAARMRRGGRLIYLGAGTPGRLGALDAAECPPTYGTDPDLVVAVVAGGAVGVVRSTEHSEDEGEAAVAALEELKVSEVDSVVGITASGRTPYVVEGLRAARAVGALTVSIANNENAESSSVAEIAIEAPTGPELVAGSTRLKAGTAQKIVLNALSTLVMVRLGKTFGNLMVDVAPGNEKLRDRGRRIVEAATGVSSEDASAALEAAGGSVKAAIVMLLADVSAEEAARRLADGRSVREALAVS